MLEEVLIVLKKYGFVLNYSKCQFLRKKIGFLRYMISIEGITLSAKHTNAIHNYKMSTNIQEFQWLLGLTNYFCKFIKDYSLKSNPLQNLLKKSAGFVFDDAYIESFKILKK